MIIKNELNNKDIKLLIYDVDGTLIDTDLSKLVEESFMIHDVPYKNEYFKEYAFAVAKSLNPTENDFCFDKLSKSFRDNFIICRDYNIDSDEYLRTLLGLEYSYANMFKGVKEVLNRLKEVYGQVISTNWFEGSQKTKLGKFDLLKNFQCIYTCEDNYPKPSEEHFNKILEDYWYSPDNCVVIGDSLSDVKASEYGFNTILVDYKNKNQGIYDYSTAVVDSFLDVEKILTKKR